MKKTINPLVSVDWSHGYDNVSDSVYNRGRVCFDLEAVQSGMIKEVGANRLGLLMVLISCMDEEGKAFPSQRHLAEVTGQSVNTVNKLINELLEVEINGQRLLRRELVGNGTRKRSLYYVTGGEVSNSEEAEVLPTEAETVAPEDKKPMNSKDYAFYFCELYEKEYGQGYAINYGRDIKMIKNKLIPAFDEETLLKVIEVSIKKYKSSWGNDKYPLPTIPMLATWVANKAYGEIQQDEANTKKQAEREKVAIEQDDSDKFLDMFVEEETSNE